MIHRIVKYSTAVLAISSLLACKNEVSHRKEVQLITVDPGHFHAALVQKSMYDQVDSTVWVYAPEGADLQLHLQRIESYNNRTDAPTAWKQQIYTGEDFFERMLQDGKGNVVVLSGNNSKKTQYILKSVLNGLHVFADKPMVIDSRGFNDLERAFEIAQENDLLLYDIMTERSEMSTILQRECSLIPELFGELEKGSPENPAITKESVHHFFKYVSGNVLTRPAWFMDVTQQGEGLVDVMTHLVDLVQWECFPEQAIDYRKDINIHAAKRWPTQMNKMEFSAITKLPDFPESLQGQLKDSLLQIYCNGEINYSLKGVHARTRVLWKYQAAEGTGDTHYSIMRGSKADLVIQQGAEDGHQPTLYILPHGTMTEEKIKAAFAAIQQKYPGVALIKARKGWKVSIPETLKEGHEAHFARVMERFLTYLKQRNMPAWEIPNMLAKYYTTTTALEMALKEE